MKKLPIVIMSLVSSILVSAGKNLIENFVEGPKNSPVDRSFQLQQFEQRLEHAMNPDKAEFNDMLSQNNVHSVEQAFALKDLLKNNLLSSADLNGFVQSNGGYNAPLQIEKNSEGFVLKSASGQVYEIDPGSPLESIVGDLYQLESVLQFSSTHPGLTLDMAVDSIFQQDRANPTNQITLY